MIALPPSTSATLSNAICARAGEGEDFTNARAGSAISGSLRLGINDVDRRAQMRFQLRLRGGSVAREHQFRQRLVLPDEPTAAIEAAHHDAAIAIGLVVEIGMGGEQAS